MSLSFGFRFGDERSRRSGGKILISLLHAERSMATRAQNRKHKHEAQVTLFEQIIVTAELRSRPHALLIIISSVCPASWTETTQEGDERQCLQRN